MAESADVEVLPVANRKNTQDEVVAARKQYNLEQVHWEGEAYKFGFKIGLLKTKGSLWKKRFCRLFLDRLDYFTKDPKKGGKPKGSMKFSTSTFARAEADSLPVCAHQAGFKHVAHGYDAENFGPPPIDLKSQYPVILGIHNCVFTDDDGNVGARTLLLAWDDDKGAATRDSLLKLINTWLPCKPGVEGRLPKALLQNLGQDPPEAKNAKAVVQAPHACATNHPCMFTIHSGIDEGGYAHRCRLDIRYTGDAEEKEGVLSNAKNAITSAVRGKDAYTHPGDAVDFSALVDNADGSYTASFTPEKPGRYVIYFTFWGREGHNSGLSVQASGTLFEIVGEGTKAGSTTDVRTFALKITNPATGEAEKGMEEKLAISVRHENEEEGELLKVRVLEDNSYEVSYNGARRGQYEVEIKVDDKYVAGTPFSFHLRPPPVSANVKPVEGADGSNGLTNGQTYNVSKFTVNLLDDRGESVGAGGDFASGALTVAVVTPSGEMADVEVEDTDDGSYNVAWQPFVPGSHSIQIQLNGKHIENSPFSAEVEPDAKYERVSALESARSDHEFFEPFLKKADAGVMMKKFSTSKLGTANERLIQIKDAEEKTAYITWNGKKGEDKIKISEITEVVSGRRQGAGGLLGGYGSAEESTLWSVVAGDDRTLDLQANSTEERDEWVRCLELIRKGGKEVIATVLEAAEAAMAAFEAEQEAAKQSALSSLKSKIFS